MEKEINTSMDMEAGPFSVSVELDASVSVEQEAIPRGGDIEKSSLETVLSAGICNRCENPFCQDLSKFKRYELSKQKQNLDKHYKTLGCRIGYLSKQPFVIYADSENDESRYINGVQGFLENVERAQGEEEENQILLFYLLKGIVKVDYESN